MKTTYTTRPIKDRIAVLRCNVFYPKGVFVTKFKTQADADRYVARQIAEDAAVRAAKVADYIAERAARPVAAVEASAQLAMF